MDVSKLRNITNNYQDVRLLSLKTWKRPGEMENRDHGGPYVIAQQGFDPFDPLFTPLEFVLGKSGEWVQLSVFFSLPTDMRQHEFIFSTSAEVIELMEKLPEKVQIIRSGKELSDIENLAREEDDGLIDAVLKAREE